MNCFYPFLSIQTLIHLFNRFNASIASQSRNSGGISFGRFIRIWLRFLSKQHLLIFLIRFVAFPVNNFLSHLLNTSNRILSDYLFLFLFNSVILLRFRILAIFLLLSLKIYQFLWLNFNWNITIRLSRRFFHTTKVGLLDLCYFRLFITSYFSEFDL